MQFTLLLALVSAMLAVADAAVQFTNPSFTGITAGTPFNITWSGANGPVNLLLKTGPAAVQVLVGSIASGVSGGSYLWTPTASGTFNLEVQDPASSSINYSLQFSVTGGTPLASITATGTASDTGSFTILTTSVPALSSSSSVTGMMTTMGITSSSVTTRAASTSTPIGSRTSTSTPSPTVSQVGTNSAAQHESRFALAIVALVAFIGAN